ncbi:MAG: hypothetical protein HUJ54_05315 [Erysipelotrichaceae bacterium]|nr:hypothetical protein [Erysipelotrichaceae bacterium]
MEACNDEKLEITGGIEAAEDGESKEKVKQDTIPNTDQANTLSIPKTVKGTGGENLKTSILLLNLRVPKA